MKYEIWMEGFIISGQQAKASKVGEYDADSFDDAVKLYNIYIVKLHTVKKLL